MTPDTTHTAGRQQPRGTQRGTRRAAAAAPQTARLLHELHAQQAALQAQNKQLHAAQARANTLKDRYSDFFDFSPVGYVSLERDGTIIEINMTGARLLGIEQVTAAGQHCEAFVTAADQAVFQEFLAQVFAARPEGNYAVELTLQTAPPRSVHLHGMLSLDGQECRAVIEDITTRKEADAALRESRRRLLTLMSNLPGMAYRCRNDQNWTMEFVSEGVFALTGYTYEELTKSAHVSYAQVIHPDDRAQVWEQVQAAVRASRPFQMVYRIITATGDEKWVWEQGQGIFNQQGALLTLEGFITDITARKQAEEQLQASEAKYRLLHESMRDAFVSVAMDGLILEYNSAYQALLGYTDDELRRMTYQEITPAQWHAAEAKILAEQIMPRGYSDVYEKEYRRKDGTLVPVELRTVLIRDARGAPAAMWAMVRDVSVRKQTEAAQLALEHQLQQAQKAESLGRMAGAIAHNFNNMMMAVLGNIELAVYSLPPGTTVEEQLREAMQAARRAADVSGLMLTYLGQTSAQHEPLDLGDACRQGLLMLRTAAPANITLVPTVASPGPIVTANARQLQQLLSNLMVNAWEACDTRPGNVQVTIRTVAPAAISAVHRFPLDWQPQADAYACLAVTDNGCGIAPENIERLFDPFFTTKFTGRGLGLPVALGIVRAHGGAIVAESTAGSGSVFQVFLPVTTGVARAD